MSYYTPSIAEPIAAPGSVVSQPTSQALVLASQSGSAFPYSHPPPIPHSYNSGYMYQQPVQYGYPQSMPVYVQPQQRVVYAMPSAYPSYGYGGMQMATPQYLPNGGTTSVIIQDPRYRRHHRRRRHSYSGYPPYGY